jgi:hypothetical protein
MAILESRLPVWVIRVDLGLSAVSGYGIISEMPVVVGINPHLVECE